MEDGGVTGLELWRRLFIHLRRYEKVRQTLRPTLPEYRPNMADTLSATTSSFREDVTEFNHKWGMISTMTP